jgi:predicted dehydrogenase
MESERHCASESYLMMNGEIIAARLTPLRNPAHHVHTVTPMTPNPLRIGILGAAGIVRKKNWQAIQCSGNAVVTAMATRDPARTRQFIAERQAEHPFPEVPRAHDSYEALLGDKTVEAVYLPLPTAVRKEWVIRAANSGKHIICEKPCAASVADLQEMLTACRRNRVQFMDGVMFMHNPRLARLREVLDDGARIGPVRRITSVFSFLGTGDFHERNIRVQSNLEPLGCLGDLGWYCLRFSLWVMRWQMPVRVSGRILAGGADTAPADFSGELLFADGASAGFHCSFLAQGQQWAVISGANGSLRVPDFVLPNSDNTAAWEVNFNPVAKTETGLYLETATAAESQEALMFRNFADQVRSGSVNEDWLEAALKTQQVADACLASARADGKLTAV